MDPVSGVDLKAELVYAEEEMLSEQRRKVRAAVSGILADLKKYQEQKIEAQKQLAKAKEQIEKASAKYEKLREGDWSVLNENMLKPNPSSENTK